MSSMTTSVVASPKISFYCRFPMTEHIIDIIASIFSIACNHVTSSLAAVSVPFVRFPVLTMDAFGICNPSRAVLKPKCRPPSSYSISAMISENIALYRYYRRRDRASPPIRREIRIDHARSFHMPINWSPRIGTGDGTKP